MMAHSPPSRVSPCPAMAGRWSGSSSLPRAFGWLCWGGWPGPTALCKGKGPEAMGGRNRWAKAGGEDRTAGLGVISAGTAR